MARRKGPAGGRQGLLYGLAGLGVLAILFFAAGPPAPPHQAPPVKPVLSKIEGPAHRYGSVPISIPKPAVAPVPALTPVPPGLAPFPKGRGKIAIVLDDWGYTLKQVPALEAIDAPLTVSVLPGLPHSADVAREAGRHGHEVILHMPMEAMNPNEPREEGRTILAGMGRSEILKLLDRSLATVPGARGMNNHQGSKVTADPKAMKVVLAEAKRRGLYFLDSVTGKSVCAEVAREVKVPFARRAVFLDNEGSVPYIRGQLAELAKAAAEKGEAVGIGHDRPATLRCLREAVPELEEAGYTLVPASELAEKAR